MFDIGFSELFLVAVIGLLVLGPERLAEVTKTAGALLRKLRKSWSAVQAEIESELATQDLKKNLIQPLEQIDEEARRGIRQVEQQIREAKQSATATGKTKLGKDTVKTSEEPGGCRATPPGRLRRPGEAGLAAPPQAGKPSWTAVGREAEQRDER